MRKLLALLFSLLATPLMALELSAPFENIDGGTLKLSQWQGQPILVVNTASQCGFTNQYSGLQALYDTYRDKGLVVLAVPSDDFNQELASNDEVKEFCELQYGIDLPMTGITPVKGKGAHPFFASVRREAGFEPAWNFNKILIGPDGSVVETYGSATKPQSAKITSRIEALLK